MQNEHCSSKYKQTKRRKKNRSKYVMFARANSSFLCEKFIYLLLFRHKLGHHHRHRVSFSTATQRATHSSNGKALNDVHCVTFYAFFISFVTVISFTIFFLLLFVACCWFGFEVKRCIFFHADFPFFDAKHHATNVYIISFVLASYIFFYPSCTLFECVEMRLVFF